MFSDKLEESQKARQHLASLLEESSSKHGAQIAQLQTTLNELQAANKAKTSEFIALKADNETLNDEFTRLGVEKDLKESEVETLKL